MNNCIRRKITVNNCTVTLNDKERRVFNHFTTNRNYVVRRSTLSEILQINDQYTSQVFHNLKNKVGKHRFETIHGIGYRFLG